MASRILYRALFLGILLLSARAEPAVCDDNAAPRQWRRYVRQCLDTLIEHGTDRYGPRKTPLMMAVLDVNTLQSPEKPLLLDSLVRLEERLHRRGERGSNLWHDQATLRAMYRMSKLTGQKKYSQAADACIAHALKHCYKADDGKTTYRNGMPAWGSHVYWDCYRECPAGDQNGDGPHEILVYRPDWAAMYRVDPEAVRRIIDGVWKWHVVDKTTGRHNRHDDARAGCDFAFSGGSFALAFSSMYNVTKEEHYLDKARLMADWHWKHRNRATDLVAEAPTWHPELESGYIAKHCFTSITGPHVSLLLRCYELTGDTHFRDIAVSYIKAYEKYGWDEKAQTYYGMLKLDGTVVPRRPKGTGYQAWEPTGHVDVWRTTMFPFEFPLVAAQSALYAYELSADSEGSKDPDLLEVSLHWAEVIEKNLPPHTGRRWKKELEAAMPNASKTGGTYAENYGRTISFFVHLYRATEKQHYLDVAENVAREAVEKLYENGLFKGHPAKPYYEATNGVGLLLHALLELAAPSEPMAGAF